MYNHVVPCSRLLAKCESVNDVVAEPIACVQNASLSNSLRNQELKQPSSERYIWKEKEGPA